MLQDKLPNKVHNILALALVDFEFVEQQCDKYVINMASFHCPLDNGLCAVCFCGSVLAGTYKVPPAENFLKNPSLAHLDKTLRDKLLMLNFLRVGEIGEAFKQLNIPVPFLIEKKVTMPDYQWEPKAFKKNLERMLALFTLLDI